MMETIHQHIPYSHTLDGQIEARLLQDGYHLESVSINKEHIIDTYVNDAGTRFVLGKDNETGYLIAKGQS
ncbi:hypothetical protein IEO70_07410 [Bacillus sp. AGMB 02131]|uniref:Uncharacterized protein n=1 Tax=Peribacillus faecalis TaxID=2772559 RepID=A0A927CV69_9BACI|nr:hypothetical protein [Peribacillus faecalis]MBD3108193.1 hypothetical protein [Peribacillus faecalis]